MDRKILNLIIVLCFVFLAGCFGKKISHISIEDDSFFVIEKIKVKDFRKDESIIRGDIWELGKVEYGYFISDSTPATIGDAVRSFSVLVGKEPASVPSSQEYIMSRWNAIFRQFTNDHLPFSITKNAEIGMHEWGGSNYDIQLFSIESNPNKSLMYVTWRKNK
jgi:hypothetical protein